MVLKKKEDRRYNQAEQVFYFSFSTRRSLEGVSFVVRKRLAQLNY
jgi:hypothetical protein